MIVISAGLYNEEHIKQCSDTVVMQCGVLVKKHIIIMDCCPKEKEHSKYKNTIEVHQIGKFGSVSNIFQGIRYAKPEPEDIICLLDLDDKLTSLQSLYTVESNYTGDTLLTYGSYTNRSNPGHNVKFCGAYTENEDIRLAKWKASHLKTFKFKLWKELCSKYFRRLKDKSNNWLMSAGDMAIMMNLYELAGYDRTKWISEKIYEYNDINPLNDHKVDPILQKSTENYIRSQKPLQRITKW